jgi:hypothetical protein
MVAADPFWIENAALAQLVLLVNLPFVERLYGMMAEGRILNKRKP